MIVDTDWHFNQGDYVEVQATQSSGGALNVISQADFSPEFYMTWVGP
jgi:hypothetical protein